MVTLSGATGRGATCALVSATVANGIVYVGLYDGQLYALNASTGTLLWYYTTIPHQEWRNPYCNSIAAVHPVVVRFFPRRLPAVFSINATRGVTVIEVTGLVRYEESPAVQLSLSRDNFRAIGVMDVNITARADTIKSSLSAVQRLVNASLSLRFVLTKLDDVTVRLQIWYSETVLSRKGLTTITLVLQKSLWTCGSAGINLFC